MTRIQRTGAYGICRDPSGRVLLVRASARTTVVGRWFLPGGGLEHGEGPAEALERELDEETGLGLGMARLLGVLSDTRVLADGTALHMVRIIYLVERWTGTARAEVTGTSDSVAWVSVEELADLDVLPYVTEALALETAERDPGTSSTPGQDLRP